MRRTILYNDIYIVRSSCVLFLFDNIKTYKYFYAYLSINKKKKKKSLLLKRFNMLFYNVFLFIQ